MDWYWYIFWFFAVSGFIAWSILLHDASFWFAINTKKKNEKSIGVTNERKEGY